MLFGIVLIVAFVIFGIIGKTLCRYRAKYHEYRDKCDKCHEKYKKCRLQANSYKEMVSSLHYVLSCYGDPYIVDFEELIEHPKVSIILPVYNKGWCIEAALRSLQRQTLKEIEIICVDDGSTDDSVEKIKKYQQHDTRIKLIENGRNRGTLYTRVHGIRESKGDYIMFLDPDDLYATNDIVEVAYNKCIELNVDVVCFGGYISRKESLKASPFCKDIESDKIYDDKDLFLTNIYRYCYNKCVKRDRWLDALNKIPDEIIDKHVCFLEDQLLNCALSLCISQYLHIGAHGYFYNLNAESICSRPNAYFPFEYCFKLINDIQLLYNTILELVPRMQDFALDRICYWSDRKHFLGPYTDEQLQQLYDIYMQINFDDEHKAKLSEYLTDGMEEMRKLRDGSSKE